MLSESATSSQLHQQCSICLDPIDATIRSMARLACGHFFHLAILPTRKDKLMWGKHVIPDPMIHGWPVLIHSRVAQQPRHLVVSRPVSITPDAAGLQAAFFSGGGNSAQLVNLNASTSMLRAAQPLLYNVDGNVRHLPQQAMGQRMQYRCQREPSTSSTGNDVVNSPYQFL